MNERMRKAMAMRRIVKDGDEVLRKRSREVTEFNKRLADLIDDMRDTLIDAEGLGLAAPQVGVLRRVVLVINAEDEIIELVNPEIISAEGENDGPEGCLSFPDIWGLVERPMKVTVRAQDRNGEYFEVSGEGITARAFCHEIDHLNGVCFVDKVSRFITPEEVVKMREEEPR